MTTKKLITEATEEELLDLLDTDTILEPIVHDYSPNDILGFISAYKFKQGKNLVRKDILYKIYCQWSKNPIDRRKFATHMGRFFEPKHPFFKMNAKAEELSKSMYIFKVPANKTKNPKWKLHFDSYLNHYNIKPGSFYVTIRVLYNLYDKWTYKNKNRNPLVKRQFLNFCRIYFNEKIVQHVYWYGVDRNIQQHLTEEVMNEMRKRNGNKKKNKTITK